MDQPPTQVVEIACNLDDASGEVVGAAIDTLLEAGALDAWVTPITMKKHRPGVTLSVLCESGLMDTMARLVIELTGTFGVRYRDWSRVVLDRRHETVTTRYGDLRIKVGSMHGKVILAKPEYDDVAAAAERHGVSVRRVMDAARAAADAWLARR